MKRTHFYLFLFILPLTFSSCRKERALESISISQQEVSLLNNFGEPGLKTGVTGYPYYHSEYASIAPERQIELVDTLGMEYYRVDLPISSDGKLSNPATLEKIIASATQKGVKLLPILQLRGLNYSSTTLTAYAQGKRLGEGFSLSYGKSLEYYQLGNLQENPLLDPKTAGNRPSHYNQEKFKVLAAFLKGMDEGIKANDAGAKTIINAGWLHYAYLQMLIDAGVAYDVVGYNWYSKFDFDAAAKFGISDIVAKLASLFQKPIWFTGINRTDGSYPNQEPEQKTWIQAFIKRCESNPAVKCVIIDNLLDQPITFQNSSDSKKHAGIIKWTSDLSGWSFKEFATALQEDQLIFGINGHPLNQVAYIKTSVSTQMDMLKHYGMNYYRVDIGTDFEGNIREQKKFDNLIAGVNNANVKILPTLYLRGMDYAQSESANFTQGKILGKGFAAKYGQHFDYYELGNEYDLKLKMAGADGRYKESYNQSQFKLFAAFLRGMIQGIKEGDSGAKTMVNGCGWNYGFFELLKYYDVNIDVIAHHLYSKSTRQNTDYIKIVQNLAAVWNNTKSIWVTELNKEDGSYNPAPEAQGLIVNDFISKLSQVPAVKAILIYELLDQPELVHNLEREKHMGLIKFNTLYDSWSYKSIIQYYTN